MTHRVVGFVVATCVAAPIALFGQARDAYTPPETADGPDTPASGRSRIPPPGTFRITARRSACPQARVQNMELLEYECYQYLMEQEWLRRQ